MHSKFKIIFLSSLLYLLTSLSGCSEPAQSAAPGAGSPDMIRRAQMVGQENIQLKKQVETLEKQAADRDKRISDLTGQLAQSQKEAADWQTRYRELERNMNVALLDCQTALERSQMDQPQVEAVDCREIEARYAETVETLMQNLLECSAKLEALQNN